MPEPFCFNIHSYCISLRVHKNYRIPRAVDIRSDRIVLLRQGIRAHPPDDGGVVHTRAVVDELQGLVEGLLLFLAGVAPAFAGVCKGRYEGIPGPASPRSERHVVAGLHDAWLYLHNALSV